MGSAQPALIRQRAVQMKRRGQPGAGGLVPANFRQQADGMGFRWDIGPRGEVMSGTNGCFSSGLMLSVNGSYFHAQRPMMTADAREYVLSQTTSGIIVTRRILVDSARSAARYIEVFQNTQNRQMQVRAEIRTRLGDACQQALTNRGATFTGALGKKDIGIVTIGRYKRPCVLFLLTDPKSKIKPTVTNRRNYEFRFTFNLTLQPNGTASIVHYVAQRRGVTPANVAVLFKPFHKTRLIKPEVPRELRKTVVNFRLAPGIGVEFVPGRLLQPVVDLAESLDVERGKSDVLVIDEAARLSGEVSCGGLKVDTAYGKAEVELEDVALLLGGASTGRAMRVYLRNGEILAGQVEAEGMKLKTTGGMEIDLPPGRVNALVMHAGPGDGKPPKGAVAFLATHSGSRLALSGDRPIAFDAATPWGPLSVKLDELGHISYSRDPQPCHRLVLADGTRLSAILRGAEFSPATLRFGPIKVTPHAIAMLTRLEPAKADEEAEDEDDGLNVAYAVLAGENRLVGAIDLPTFRVATAAGVTVLDPKEVVSVERRDDATGAFPLFTFELRKGGTVSGRFEERVLPIRSGKRLLRIPVQHFVSYHGAEEPEPEAEEEANKEAKGPEGGEKDEAADAAPPRRVLDVPVQVE